MDDQSIIRLPILRLIMLVSNKKEVIHREGNTMSYFVLTIDNLRIYLTHTIT